MADLEKERSKIRSEEKTRVAMEMVSNFANQVLKDLEKGEIGGNCSGSSSKSRPYQGKKDAPKKTHNFKSNKNYQRGSKSLSDFSNSSGPQITSYNSGAKPKNSNFTRSCETAPRGAPPPYATPLLRAPPPLIARPPPSYEQSVRQASYISGNQNYIPPFTQYGMTGHSQNFPGPGTVYPGAYQPQQELYSNFPHSSQNYPQHLSQTFQPPKAEIPKPTPSVSTQTFQPPKAEIPKPTPRVSTQNKSGSTDSAPDSKAKKQTKEGLKIDVNLIVRELSDCHGNYLFLKNLAYKLNTNSSDLLIIIRENDHVFSTLNDRAKRDSAIELCPKINLCKDHQQSGCNTKNCSEIHLCEEFIHDKCILKDCPLGHSSSFKSNHNVNILKKYYMSILPNSNLQQVFQKVWQRSVTPQLCFDYYYGKCEVENKCTNIHLCFSYVNNLGLCDNKNCNFSHDIRDSKLALLFKTLGISTNESPRDLLKILKKECLDGRNENDGGQKVPKSKSLSDDKQECKVKKDLKDKEKNKVRKSGTNLQNENSTVFCADFHGTVKKAKICMDGIKLNCKFIRSGCHNLHCNHKSHWQFGNDNKWYNFHLYHSQILDTRFSDPNCENFTLPKLDFSRLNASQKNLITVLGKQNLKINFINMTLYVESSDTTYSVRNLTTDSSVLAINDNKNTEKYTVFKWYFKDNDEEWKLYDNCDTIERVYIEDSNKSTTFKSANFSYIIDFVKMTQENKGTKKVRPLRRRPFISRSDKTSTNYIKKDYEEKVQLPKTWDEMKNESFKRVKLNISGDEYTDIRQRLALSLPMINIVNIWRLQNVFLWQKFKNKEKALKKHYDDNFLNIQKLFHGIESDSIDDIVRENIEFRRHSVNADRAYGEGTYFYTSASAGAQNCRADAAGKKTLLIADVIIGKVTEGSEGLTRPPENPLFNAMYDTTTDDVQNPTVYVKYSSLEYYPAYIVEFY